MESVETKIEVVRLI